MKIHLINFLGESNTPFFISFYFSFIPLCRLHQISFHAVQLYFDFHVPKKKKTIKVQTSIKCPINYKRTDLVFEFTLFPLLYICIQCIHN